MGKYNISTIEETHVKCIPGGKNHQKISDGTEVISSIGINGFNFYPKGDPIIDKIRDGIKFTIKDMENGIYYGLFYLGDPPYFFDRITGEPIKD